MRKIISGLVGLTMLASVVGLAAYAAFTSQATMENVTFATGNATLTVGGDGESYYTNWMTDWTFDNMYPGDEKAPKQVWVRNESSAPIDLTISMQLTDGGVNWENGLEDVIWVKVENSDDSAGASWMTLADWNNMPSDYPGSSLAPGATRMYKLYVKMDPAATSDYADLSLPGVVFTLTGTQVMPI